MEKTIRIPAKINLYLDVTDKMPNGYHELETVMQSIDIFDIVTLRSVRGNGKISVSAKEGKQRADLALPQPRNTAYRAAELFAATYPDALSKDGMRVSECDFEIELIKNIPSEAGLGGASADAAAVLTILSDIFNTGATEDELIALGAKIGADVPFCIRRGTVLVILSVMNIIDRFLVDGFWVGHTKAWTIPGTEDLKPYITGKDKCKKWIFGTVGMAIISAVLSGIMMIFVR